MLKPLKEKKERERPREAREERTRQGKRATSIAYGDGRMEILEILLSL